VQLLRPIAVATALVGLALAFATGTAAAATPADTVSAAVCRSSDAVSSTGWAGVRAPVADRALSFSGTIDYVARSTGTSAWLSVGGGGRTLDLIQVGIHDCGTGPRFFAAWGAGAPGVAGSTYEEVDLGAADLRAHAYSITLARGTWRLAIDGRVARTVSDDFRTWPIAWIQSMTESHTDVMADVAVTRLVRTQAGATSPAAFGYTAVGAPALGALLDVARAGFTVSAR
jgi:hypothetical protein